ncbi:MAG: hypothetical protein NUV63_00685 [Gallionella sp.]|nr:hypothetical protein [Gallionella sp.]
MNLVIPDLIRNPAETNIGALCAPLDTGLTAGQFILSLSKDRYDGDANCRPDQ